MLKIMIFGISGKMGQILAEQILEETGMEVVAGISRKNKVAAGCPVYEDPFEYKGEVDIILDFSNPENLSKMLEYATQKSIPTVIATTGYSDDQLLQINEASKNIPVVLSANMSLGINITSRILTEISPILENDFDMEIIEKHHNKKLDAPSGTALLLAKSINGSLKNSKRYIYGRAGNSMRQNDEMGIHAIRGGTIAGEHTIIFAGPDEIIEIKHTALSKKIFATGAIKAARFIRHQQAGLYSMEDVLDEQDFG